MSIRTQGHLMPTVADRSTERDVGLPPVLEVRNLSITFHDRRGSGRAVDDVSFVVQAGEAVGLVGESGSGKSVTAMAIMGLLPQNAEVSGEILFHGVDLLSLSSKARASYRGRHLSMILQDPMSSLDPVFTVRSQLGESLRLHQKLPRAQRRQTAIELLRLLQIPAPERVMGAYPHELSGGMRQRVAGAIALSCEPDILIADEPTTALDPTVQARYLDTIEAAQKRLGFGVIFITHDFGVVTRLCSQVVVMYSGSVMESGPTATILREAENPYTKALLESVPDLYRPAEALPSIPGAPPSIFAKPNGCPFSPRCPVVMDRCVEQVPPSATISTDHVSRCWRHE
jgi:oligopeptide/dipeptide ABC transporter ATP-binding protein